MPKRVIVVGAGIVGVSTALQLQLRGWKVLLIDRTGVGEGTSFGNAGLIQREAVAPRAFPTQAKALLRYTRNKTTDSRYELRDLPGYALPLLKYWRYSIPGAYREVTRRYAALIARCITDHQSVASLAGVSYLYRPGGYLQVHRTSASLEAELRNAEFKNTRFGVEYTPLDASALRARVPGITSDVAGAIHWEQPLAVVDPYVLTQAYLAYFLSQGGEFRVFSVNQLRRCPFGWCLQGDWEVLRETHVVLTTGAWSTDLAKTLDWAPGVFVKRGYHMRYADNAAHPLDTPLYDADAGCVLAPMLSGLRLTTGAEFADRDAPPTPFALDRVEPLARQLYPSLGDRLAPTPWLGHRPCTSDMLPIIGSLPNYPGIWFNFGHCHQGLTMAPTSGILLAQLMNKEAPVINPRPYSPSRFTR